MPVIDTLIHIWHKITNKHVYLRRPEAGTIILCMRRFRRHIDKLAVIPDGCEGDLKKWVIHDPDPQVVYQLAEATSPAELARIFADITSPQPGDMPPR